MSPDDKLFLNGNKMAKKRKKKGKKMETETYPLIKETPTVLLNLYAHAKLMYLARTVKREVAGLCFAPDPARPFEFSDILIPKQTTTAASFDFDAEDLALLLADLKTKYHPVQYSLAYIHTHPGDGVPSPSQRDINEFHDAYLHAPVGVMVIAGKDGHYIAKMRIESNGYAFLADLKARPSIALPFEASDFDGWQKEVDEKIKERIVKTYTCKATDYQYGGDFGFGDKSRRCSACRGIIFNTAHVYLCEVCGQNEICNYCWSSLQKRTCESCKKDIAAKLKKETPKKETVIKNPTFADEPCGVCGQIIKAGVRTSRLCRYRRCLNRICEGCQRKGETYCKECQEAIPLPWK
ncbi:MAG: Mov34/MPN/PAD-1 family protein [Candidatus Colwellbacteria bacterium]|nr:Mov34/MPN/PAD-1 family protein [Candidatus Colwellbacteria bacterium]